MVDIKQIVKKLIAETDPKKAAEQIADIAKTVSTEQLEKIQREFEKQTRGQR